MFFIEVSHKKTSHYVFFESFLHKVFTSATLYLKGRGGFGLHVRDIVNEQL